MPAIAMDCDGATRPATVGRRRRDALVAVAFLAMLVSPSAAFVAGVRTENQENRALATLPPMSLTALGDVGTYVALDRFAADRFPFRAAAALVDASGRYLLGTSASREVVIGDDGWLFSLDALQARCAVGPEVIATASERVDERLRGAGVSFYVVIVPDKQAVYPDRRPRWARPCTDDFRPAMRDAFAARSGTLIDLWTPLRAAADTDEELLYWPKDTHWNPSGGLIGVRTVVRTVAPSVWNEQAVRRSGTAVRVGDLSRLMGMPSEEQSTGVSIETGNAVAVNTIPVTFPTPPGRELRTFTSTGPAPTVDGSTLIIHDSGFGVHANLIAPWFESSTWLHVNLLSEHPEIVDELPAYDRIIVERVERFAYGLQLDALLDPVVRRAELDGP